MSKNTLGPNGGYIDHDDHAGTVRSAGAWFPLPVTDAPPLEFVTPDVSASPQSMQVFGDGTNDIHYLLVTINAGDDVTAGAQLKNGYPDVHMIIPGTFRLLRAGAAITRIDIVAYGDVESSTPTAGEIAVIASSEATIRSLMQTFTFDASDNVRSALLTTSQRYSAGTAGVPAATAHYVRALLEGRKHV